jgi:hypothetical protein
MPPTALISAILQTGLAVIYAAIGVIVMLFAIYYGGRCAIGIMSAAADFVKSHGEWALDDWNRRAILNQRREAKDRFVGSVVGLAIAVLVGTIAFNFGVRWFFWK